MFPSPSGDSRLSEGLLRLRVCRICRRFRPLPGIHVFRSFERDPNGKGYRVRFPSPSGDSRLSELNAVFRLFAPRWVFPSPSGDSRLSESPAPVDLDFFPSPVSVPFRGFTSFGGRLESFPLAPTSVLFPTSFGVISPTIHPSHSCMSFRPLPGIHVFRSRTGGVFQGKAQECFRPLPGIHVFRRYLWESLCFSLWSVSVPFRGFTSFGVGRKKRYHHNSRSVSVPFRGFTSFGVLSSSTLLITPRNVSVPFRGFTSFGGILSAHW